MSALGLFFQDRISSDFTSSASPAPRSRIAPKSEDVPELTNRVSEMTMETAMFVSMPTEIVETSTTSDLSTISMTNQLQQNAASSSTEDSGKSKKRKGLFRQFGGDCPRWAVGGCKNDVYESGAFMNGRQIPRCVLGLHRSVVRPKGNIVLCHHGWNCLNERCTFFHYNEPAFSDCRSYALGKGCEDPTCPHRHVFTDRSGPVCGSWKSKTCWNLACSQRHPDHELIAQMDCYFYHFSPARCNLGDRCSHRHDPQVNSKVLCPQWEKNGVCTSECRKYHPVMMKSSATVPSSTTPSSKHRTIENGGMSLIQEAKITAPVIPAATPLIQREKEEPREPKSASDRVLTIHETRMDLLRSACDRLVKLADLVTKCESVPKTYQDSISEAARRAVELLMNDQKVFECMMQLRVVCEWVVQFVFAKVFGSNAPKAVGEAIKLLKFGIGGALTESTSGRDNISENPLHSGLVHALAYLNSKVRAAPHKDRGTYTPIDIITTLIVAGEVLDTFIQYVMQADGAKSDLELLASLFSL